MGCRNRPWLSEWMTNEWIQMVGTKKNFYYEGRAGGGKKGRLDITWWGESLVVLAKVTPCTVIKP